MNEVKKTNVPRGGAVAQFQGPRLPWHDEIQRRFGDIGITRATWPALCDSLFPGVDNVNSILMALSYCKARSLDPFKRMVHIVPIYSRTEKRMVDTVWPAIAELRTTAFRTGQYAGMDPAEFGPDLTREFRSDNGVVTVIFPEWCSITVHRQVMGMRVAFAGPRVYWLEAYAKKKRGVLAPNEMWETRVRGQLEKCAEAAALRRAFPEEVGNILVADEVGGGTVEIYDAPDDRPTARAGDAGRLTAREPDKGEAVEADSTGQAAEDDPADDGSEPFYLVDADGVASEFENPGDYATALMGMITDERRPSVITGIWASNDHALARLQDEASEMFDRMEDDYHAHRRDMVEAAKQASHEASHQPPQ